MNSKIEIEAALYHLSRCKMPGFLAPIDFVVKEDLDCLQITAVVSSWPQYPNQGTVRFEKVSKFDLYHDPFDIPKMSKIETETIEKKTFKTQFMFRKQDLLGKSLYEIADMCNDHMKRCVMELCRGMMNELWQC